MHFAPGVSSACSILSNLFDMSDLLVVLVATLRVLVEVNLN